MQWVAPWSCVPRFKPAGISGQCILCNVREGNTHHKLSHER